MDPKNPDYNSVKQGEIVNTSGVCGSIYQVKLLMLFLERGFHYKIPFKLTTELKEAEKFDDLFFENEETKEFYFLQAKHKSNESYRIRFQDLINSDYSSNYNLVKYLYSYLYSKKNPLFANGTIKQVLMFTNANFDLDSKFKGATLSGYVEKIEHTDEILNFAHDIVKSQLAQYRFKPEIKPLLRPYIERFMFSKIDHVSDDDVDDFLDKFIFAVGQPNEEELDVIIKNDLVKFAVFKNYVNFKNSIYNNYLNLMLNWYKSGKKTFGEIGYLHHEGIRSIFQLLMKELKKLELQAFSLELLSKVDDFTIKYKPEAICKIKQFLTSRKKILNITSAYKTLTSIKVVQACKEETKSKDDCIFLKSSESHLFERVMNVFESDVNLLIVVNSHEENTLKLFAQLQAVLQLYNNKKIIFIGEENKKLIEEIETLKKEDYVVIQDHKYDLIESKEQLAGRVEVFFEGEKFKLNELFIDKIDPFNADLLSKLLNNEKIEIGKQVSDLENGDHFYTDRYLYRKIGVDVQFFKVDKSSIFVFDVTQTFSTFCEDKSLKWLCGDEPMVDFDTINFKENRKVRFIFIKNPNDYEVICERFPACNIHWFEIECDQSVSWKGSHGSLHMLLDYLTKRHTGLVDFQPGLNILCAEPGMGKSTYLVHVAKSLKQYTTKLVDTESRSSSTSRSFPHWVILIKLNKHTKKLSDTKFNNNLKNAIMFLSNILNMKSVLEIHLFLQCFAGGPVKIDLLFDDFDEICPDHKETCVELFQLLQKSAVNHLIIATRPYTVQRELEKELNMSSCYFCELTSEQSKTYLLQYWRRSLKLSKSSEGYDKDNINKIISFAENILKKFKTSFKEDELNFISFPLHLAMIAELFESELQEYIADKLDINFFEQFNLFNLYEKFIKEKYFKIHCGSKQAKDLTNPTVKITEKKMYSVFLHDHQLMACHASLKGEILSAMLTNEEINKEIPELMKEIEDGEFKVGLIDTVVNNKPHFVHKTYEEFFVARLLLNKFCSIPLDDSKFTNFIFTLSNQLMDTSLTHAFELFANINIDILISNNVNIDDFKERLMAMFRFISELRFECHKLLYRLLESFMMDLQLMKPIINEIKQFNEVRLLFLLNLPSIENDSNLLKMLTKVSLDSLDRNSVQADLKLRNWNDTVVWYCADKKNFNLLKSIASGENKLYNVEWLDKNGRNLLNAIIEFENKYYSGKILLSCVDANALSVNRSSSDTELNENTLLFIKSLKNNYPMQIVYPLGKDLDFDYIRTFIVNIPGCPKPVSGEQYIVHLMINYLESRVISYIDEYEFSTLSLLVSERATNMLSLFSSLVKQVIKNGAFYLLEDFNGKSIKTMFVKFQFLDLVFKQVAALCFKKMKAVVDITILEEKFDEVRKLLINGIISCNTAFDPKVYYKICVKEGYVVLKASKESPKCRGDIFLFPNMFEDYFKKVFSRNKFNGLEYLNDIWKKIEACFDKQGTIHMKYRLASNDLSEILTSTSDNLLKSLCQQLQCILSTAKLQYDITEDINNLKLYVKKVTMRINDIVTKLKERNYKANAENRITSKDVSYILSIENCCDKYKFFANVNNVLYTHASNWLQRMLSNLDKYCIDILCQMKLQHYTRFFKDSHDDANLLNIIDKLFIKGVTMNDKKFLDSTLRLVTDLKNPVLKEELISIISRARNDQNLTLTELAWKNLQKNLNYFYIIQVLEKRGIKIKKVTDDKLLTLYQKFLIEKTGGCGDID